MRRKHSITEGRETAETCSEAPFSCFSSTEASFFRSTLEIASGEVCYVGVGNSVIRRLGSQEARLFSADGNVGETLRTPREQSLRLANDDVLAPYTDGLRTNFDVDDYPQLRYEPAAAIAKTLVARFGRPYDDATCLVVRYQR